MTCKRIDKPRERTRHTDAIDKIGVAILHESHAILTRELVLRFQSGDSGQSWKSSHKLVIWQLPHLEPSLPRQCLRTRESDKSDCSSRVLIRNPSHAPSSLDREPVRLFVGQLMSLDTMTLAKFFPSFCTVNSDARPKLDEVVHDPLAP